MKAIGILETRGLLASVEGLDIMLKTASVSLVKSEKIGGGLVTTIIVGSVSNVKASVDAAKFILSTKGSLISSHVIPRVRNDVYDVFLEPLVSNKEVLEKSEDKVVDNSDEEKIIDDKIILKTDEKEVFTKESLNKKTVEQLRKLLRAVKNKNVLQKEIKYLKKDKLIKELLNSQKKK